jgi:lipopolysaccharide export system protein LptA
MSMARFFTVGLAIAALGFCGHANVAAAQDQYTAPVPSANGGGFDLGNSSQPIEISADDGIEWDRDYKTYTARGNAVASQGNSELHADTLTAYYTGSSSQIDHIVADGSVKIMNPTETAFGDHADYNRVKRLLVLTGNALKIQATGETVTARDALEYWQDQDAMVARGNVVIVKSNGTVIKTDLATSYFGDNAQSGKREAFQVKAEGHVHIDTGKEQATCDRAVYDPNTQIAVLTGHVVLVQGRSTFQGARGEIDMNKGVSRLLPAPGQRVRTVIQPKNSDQNTGAPATSTGGAIASSAANTGASNP